MNARGGAGGRRPRCTVGTVDRAKLCPMEIGILGATGPAGRALAARLASLGHRVTIGSRERGRAEEAVAGLRDRWGDRLDGLAPGTNEEAASSGELVVLAVPWQAAAGLAGDLAPRLSGKVVVSMANALERRGDGFEAVVPPDGSVAAAVRKAAPDARVVAAFHHVPARELGALDHGVDADVLVCSDDRDAAAVVADLARQIPGVRPVDTGDLGNAIGIEAFTAVLLSVNVRHRVRAGVRLTGLAP